MQMYYTWNSCLIHVNMRYAWKENQIRLKFYLLFFMYKMLNLCILNDLPQFEFLEIIYQRDWEVKVHHDVNKAQVFYLLRKNAKYEITISP